MAGVNATFQGLQPIAGLQTLGHVRVRQRQGGELPLGQSRLTLWWAHVNPNHATTFNHGVGLELDAIGVAAVRLGGHLDALACDVVFPTVVRATDSALFVSAKPQRHTTVCAKLIDQTQTTFGVTESQHFFGQ
jgi:hypothetical protein